jgi:hypothetical protein
MMYALLLAYDVPRFTHDVSPLRFTLSWGMSAMFNVRVLDVHVMFQPGKVCRTLSGILHHLHLIHAYLTGFGALRQALLNSTFL